MSWHIKNMKYIKFLQKLTRQSYTLLIYNFNQTLRIYLSNDYRSVKNDT